MNKKDWIKYNHEIINQDKDNTDDRKLEDIFNRYQLRRNHQLLKLLTKSYRDSLVTDKDSFPQFTARLCKMIAINESAVLRLWAVAVDPKSSRNDLIDSFRIFINDVMDHGDNQALREFRSRL